MLKEGTRITTQGTQDAMQSQQPPEETWQSVKGRFAAKNANIHKPSTSGLTTLNGFSSLGIQEQPREMQESGLSSVCRKDGDPKLPNISR